MQFVFKTQAFFQVIKSFNIGSIKFGKLVLTGPLCFNIPSNDSQVKFNPSKFKYLCSKFVSIFNACKLWLNPPFFLILCSVPLHLRDRRECDQDHEQVQ